MNTVPLHTLFLAIHTARGGRIKLRNINNIFKQRLAIVECRTTKYLVTDNRLLLLYTPKGSH